MAVVDGAIVTGRPVLWACQRHLEDLEHGHERGVWFDERSAEAFFRFAHLLRHFEGPLGAGDGARWMLEPWQQFVFGSVFGWLRDDGSRRFREAWVEVAKKQGKSFSAAAVGNYLLAADKEPGAQIYTAAAKREQARIIHRAAIAQRDKSPELRMLIKKHRDRLFVPATRSFFAPLSKDAATEEGINPSGGLIDEIHVLRDGALWDVLESAMAARRQPLIFATTTAGAGVGTFGRQQHDYYLALLDPESGVERDSAFAYIASLDLAVAEGEEGDDPYDELVWEKAAPNLGVSVSIDFMRERSSKARQHNRFEADFFTKNLNIWIQAERRWIAAERWDAGAAELDVDALARRPCFSALDLSSTTDLTAYALYFPPTREIETAASLEYYWCPEEAVEERARRDRVDYSSWIRDGWIEPTPGDWVDQDRVKKRMKELRKRFPQLQQTALDMKFAAKLAVELEVDGFDVLRFPQGYATFCAPTLEFERQILSGLLLHLRNPVTRWMMGNIVLKKGTEGDVMPSKAKSAEKIDGPVALIMAIGAAGLHPAKPPRQPVHRALSSRRKGPGKRKIYGVFR